MQSDFWRMTKKADLAIWRKTGNSRPTSCKNATHLENLCLFGLIVVVIRWLWVKLGSSGQPFWICEYNYGFNWGRSSDTFQLEAG